MSVTNLKDLKNTLFASMKIKLQIVTFGLMTVLLSCGQPKEIKNNVTVPTDTLQPKITQEVTEEERIKTRKEVEESEAADSLRLDKVLQDALKIATQNFSKDKFIEKYEVAPDSSLVKVEINLDYHFTKSKPHLIIKRSDSGAIYFDIYSKIHNRFEKVLSHEQWSLTYENDTIRDINGDGLNDFVVNWYGANGCCLKGFSNVFLLRKDQESFSENFEFINPTFSPKEKVIRGVCYGQPGETEMYKYKWNGEKVDTLEYVSYQMNDKRAKTGKVIISTDLPYRDKSKTLKILNSVPKEYSTITGYDWFTGIGM